MDISSNELPKIFLHKMYAMRCFGNPCQVMRILQIDKICNNKTPFYLNDVLPPNPIALFNGNTCNTFHEIICKSNRYTNSFSPDATSSWNIFIKHFDELPSCYSLKTS